MKKLLPLVLLGLFSCKKEVTSPETSNVGQKYVYTYSYGYFITTPTRLEIQRLSNGSWTTIKTLGVFNKSVQDSTDLILTEKDQIRMFASDTATHQNTFFTTVQAGTN